MPIQLGLDILTQAPLRPMNRMVPILLELLNKTELTFLNSSSRRAWYYFFLVFSPELYLKKEIFMSAKNI